MAYQIERNIVVDRTPQSYGYSQPPYAYVVAHSTGNRDKNTNAPNGSFDGNVNWLHDHWDNANYTHLVGDGRVAQLMEVNQGSWNAGSNINNDTYASVELLEGAKFSREDYENYVNLLRQLADDAGIPKRLDRDGKSSGIKTHNFVTRVFGATDHVDPQPFLEYEGISFEQFQHDVENGFGEGGADVTPIPLANQTVQPSGPDQVLNVGSTVRIDGNFSLDDLVEFPAKSGKWYAVSNPLAIPKVDYHNYIPVGPLTETDDQGNPTADQDFSNAGHSYFNFGGQTFKVTNVDADADAVEVRIGGEPVWMPAGPITEVEN
ncbi:peptidoglycan recognition family protein [Leuconostoc lactis]|uniref:peptidoglycan recognition family protein n=1 Tax=Leuconostoc lactis TaxID=1246 RepID=UPI00289AA090|nr:peptidoglycan recognition family protein [Leuconostoc lactis]